MDYTKEIQSAKRIYEYYTGLQEAQERRMRRAQRAAFWHRYGKAIGLIGGALALILLVVIIITGMMWAEGTETALSNTICIASFVLCIGIGAGLRAIE